MHKAHSLAHHLYYHPVGEPQWIAVPAICSISHIVLSIADIGKL